MPSVREIERFVDAITGDDDTWRRICEPALRRATEKMPEIGELRGATLHGHNHSGDLHCAYFVYFGEIACEVARLSALETAHERVFSRPAGPPPENERTV